MTMKPLVHVLDDDQAVRDSIRELLASIEIEAVAYASAHDFFEAGGTARPGCILLDLRIPDMSGLDVQRRLVEQDHGKPVIFLSGHGDVDVAVQAMQQGAAGFLSKPVDAEALLKKVREAIEQDREQQAAMHNRATVRARLALLSHRESQVLEHVVAGEANKEIARALNISLKTVELHRGNVMAKMRADSLAELVRLRLSVDAPTTPARPS